MSKLSIANLVLALITSTLLAAVEPASAGGAAPPSTRPVPIALPDQLLKQVAVFGKDDRITISGSHRNLRNVIGLLFNNASRTVCSAFCVAENVIATAAHCLYKTNGARRPDLGAYQFSRYATDDRTPTRLAGSSTGSSAQHIMAGSTELSTRPPIDATSDWALVRLARPACSQGHLTINPMGTDRIIDAAKRGQVYQVAFHRDLPGWPLAYSTPCDVARDYPSAEWAATEKEFSKAHDLLLHTCDTGGASSGSPLLVDGQKGPEVVGINVGTYVLSRVAIRDGQVLRRFKPENVANTAVSARDLAKNLLIFNQATILATGQPIRVVQEQLQERKHYKGAIDGRFGRELRSAIQSFEQTEGLPVTGLATLALLRRLGSQHQETSRTGSIEATPKR